MKKTASARKSFLAALLALVMVSLTLINAGAAQTISEDEISAIVNTTTDPSLVTSPFIQVANQVRNSVVGVNNYVKQTTYYGYYGYGYGGRPGEEKETLAGTGSGVVISNYGHVLTNYHVVENASRLTVTIANDESEHEGALVGFDANLDLAILHVPTLELPAVPLGDSDQLQVGEWAIVIGNPLGEEFARTTTVGVVSAIDRQVTDTTLDRYGRRTSITNSMIQVDAAINSGNSGGGMFNVLGQLQGIPARKYSSNGFYSASIENIGMCIPVNVAKPLIEEVLRAYNGDTEKKAEEESTEETTADLNNPLKGKPRLGITGGTLNSNTRNILPMGAIVKSVDAGSPAEEGGILPGDIIVEVDGTVISNMNALTDELAGHQEGDVIKIKVYRDEALAEQINSGEQYIDLSKVGEGDYVDLTVTLRVVDDMNL